MNSYIKAQYQASHDLFARMMADETLQANAEYIAHKGVEVLKNGGKIMLCGNGGSAADAQHLAAELVSRLYFQRPGLHAIALTTDSSSLTAISNDYGFEQVFARQVEAIGQPGDMLIGISTSGTSPNVLEAVRTASERDIITVGFLGQDGRDIGKAVDHQINIPSNQTPNIQEGHICTGHIICALIEQAMFGAEYNTNQGAA